MVAASYSVCGKDEKIIPGSKVPPCTAIAASGFSVLSNEHRITGIYLRYVSDNKSDCKVAWLRS